MNLTKDTAQNSGSDAVLLKAKSTVTPAMLSNSISVPAVTSWTCKNVPHSNDVQPKYIDKHSAVAAPQSASSIQDEVKRFTQREGLTSETLLKAFNHLEIAMALFKINDCDAERSSSVNANIVRDIACYTKMYEEKEKTFKQLVSATSKTPGAAVADIKGSNDKKRSGYSFKRLLPTALDNSAVSPLAKSQDKIDNSMVGLPMDLKEKCHGPTEDIVLQAASEISSFDLVTEQPLSVGLNTCPTMSEKKSSSELCGACPKLPCSAKPSTGPSHDTKTQEAELEHSFDAGEIATQNPIIVYFDLETTGLSYCHEIVQVSGICSSLEEDTNSASFNVYALPQNDFDPRASAVTQLQKQNNSLYWKGKKVPSVSLSKCLRKFVSWLQGLPRPALLVGHNSKRFDAPRLLLALWNNNLLSTFQKTVWGFADSLPLARALDPNRRGYSLEELVAQFCSSGMNISAHNALDDCFALEIVVLALTGIQLQNPASLRLVRVVAADHEEGDDATQKNGAGEKNVCEKVQLNCREVGQNNGGNCTPEVNNSQEDDCTQTTLLKKSQAFAACAPCFYSEKKRNLLESFQPYVFSTNSVFEGLRKSKAAKACLTPNGS
ncbi:Exonuclease RNase T/DNA polymerase III [Trinorchestia longiramus]|nr:Exonuclease RNase T/DNA polymerase III [Trinorchestia longiramus]